MSALLHRLATVRHGGGSVPLLIHASKRFTDSTEILLHADSLCEGEILYPHDRSLRLAVEAITARFDKELGEHSRRWAYFHLLNDNLLINRLRSRGVPGLAARLVPFVTPLVRRLVRKVYRITPPSAQRSLQRIESVFQDVEERLRDQRRFIIGKAFTAADLTFAALAAPVLFPAECRAVLPTLEEVPTAMRKEIVRLRATEAGQFALRIYREEREAAPPIS